MDTATALRIAIRALRDEYARYGQRTTADAIRTLEVLLRDLTTK